MSKHLRAKNTSTHVHVCACVPRMCMYVHVWRGEMRCMYVCVCVGACVFKAVHSLGAEYNVLLFYSLVCLS